MEVFSRGSGPSIIRCLTYSVPEAAFLRIMHLPDGNYILIGPEQFSDIGVSRRRDNELWFLSKELGSKPIKLGQKMSEGAAISKKNMKMACCKARIDRRSQCARCPRFLEKF